MPGRVTAIGLAAVLLALASGCQPRDAERAPRGPLADVALTFAISLAEEPASRAAMRLRLCQAFRDAAEMRSSESAMEAD